MENLEKAVPFHLVEAMIERAREILGRDRAIPVVNELLLADRSSRARFESSLRRVHRLTYLFLDQALADQLYLALYEILHSAYELPREVENHGR